MVKIKVNLLSFTLFWLSRLFTEIGIRAVGQDLCVERKVKRKKKTSYWTFCV